MVDPGFGWTRVEHYQLRHKFLLFSIPKLRQQIFSANSIVTM